MGNDADPNDSTSNIRDQNQQNGEPENVPFEAQSTVPDKKETPQSPPIGNLEGKGAGEGSLGEETEKKETIQSPSIDNPEGEDAVEGSSGGEPDKNETIKPTSIGNPEMKGAVEGSLGGGPIKVDKVPTQLSGTPVETNSSLMNDLGKILSFLSSPEVLNVIDALKTKKMEGDISNINKKMGLLEQRINVIGEDKQKLTTNEEKLKETEGKLEESGKKILKKDSELESKTKELETKTKELEEKNNKDKQEAEKNAKLSEDLAKDLGKSRKRVDGLIRIGAKCLTDTRFDEARRNYKNGCIYYGQNRLIDSSSSLSEAEKQVWDIINDRSKSEKLQLGPLALADLGGISIIGYTAIFLCSSLRAIASFS